MKTVEDYKKELIESKNETAEVMKLLAACIDGANKKIKELEEENKLLLERLDYKPLVN